MMPLYVMKLIIEVENWDIGTFYCIADGIDRDDPILPFLQYLVRCKPDDVYNFCWHTGLREENGEWKTYYDIAESKHPDWVHLFPALRKIIPMEICAINSFELIDSITIWKET